MIKVRSSAAFTMIEMLVVVGLIGMIFAFVAPKIVRMLRQSDEQTIKFKFNGIKSALNEYKLEFGTYPSTKEGLKALVSNPRPNDDRFKRYYDAKGGFLKEADIADKQEVEFTYHCPPEKFKGKYRYFEIIYLGPSQSEDDPERLDDGV